ncbi:MAG: DUF819 family protein [Pseudomonadota bacterium]
MVPILAILFFVLFPALILFICHKYPPAGKIGGAALCFFSGLMLSVLGLVPDAAKGAMEGLMNITVPLAIPLMLFSMDLKSWTRLAGKTILSLVLMFTAALTASTAAYFLLGRHIEDAAAVSGMLIGMYTGGTPNMNAIGLALDVKEHILVLTNTADMLLSTPLFLFFLLFAKRIFGLILPPFVPAEAAGPETTGSEPGKALDFDNYQGIFRPEILKGLAGALGLSLAVFAAGLGLFLVTPKEYNMAALMLTITTLGIACSLFPRVRDIRMTFQLGQFIILIFCLAVGAMADVNRLFSAASTIILYTAIILFGALLIHVILSAVFRIDVDTTLVIATAAIYSPPFVPAVAAAIKNKEVVASGLAAGIMGYAAGNYLGVALAHLLKQF